MNKFRPETRDIDGAIEIKEEIERTGKLPFTGIVNNSNLGSETTEEDILSGFQIRIRLTYQGLCSYVY